MPLIAEKQDATAAWLVNGVLNVSSDRYALFNLAGAVGAGKTTVLGRVAERLRNHGLVPVLMTAPQGEVDSAAIAMLEAAQQMKAANLVNGEFESLADPCASWARKMDVFTSAINAKRNSVVVLCDEPTRWYHREPSLLDDTPEFCARQLSEWISTEASCRRIVTGRLPVESLSDHRTRAPRMDDGIEALSVSTEWSQLRPFADGLREHVVRPVRFRSIWEMKLCVALAAFKSVSEVAVIAQSEMSADSMLQLLLDHFESSDEYHPLCRALAKLAIVRTSIEGGVLVELLHDLAPLSREVIEDVLCHWETSTTSLHPLVRHEVLFRARDPRRRDRNQCWHLTKAERVIVHRRLADEYGSHDPEHLRWSLESLYHDILGGESLDVVTTNRVHFAEQLHAIGRSLSYAHHEHRKAAEVFRLSLQFAPHHAYGHHYLAFNLDWLAEQQDDVEAHYRAAIEYQPTHPWWWSRWISYLATRGRFLDAKNSWREAIDALSIDEGSSPDWIFLSLHRWVAR